MSADSARFVPRAHLLATAGLTAVLSLGLLTLGSAPADAPAHLYRTFLVRDGAFIWDNLWFGGQYPLASYSLLYYFPAAVVGNVPLVLGSTIASAVLFASVTRREFGDAALWPGRAFAVLAAAPLFTGLYTYAAGFALLLGALAAAQRGARCLTAVLAALTLGASPLAFAFLLLILVAFSLAGGVRKRTVLALGIPLTVIALVEVVALGMFRSPGLYPFHAVNLVGVLVVCASGALLARRAPRGRPLVALYTLWAAGSLVLFAVPTPLGDNWTRLYAVAFPAALLAAALTGWRPRWLALAAVTAALVYNLAPYALLVPIRSDTRPQARAFWTPALAFLQRRSSPGYRVEVVPTATHWEAYWFPRLGFSIARGWYQQLDMTTNPVMYDPDGLTPAAYKSWLRSRGVRYVVLPRARLDSVARGERRLLTSGASGLRIALRASTLDIFELRQATPILTGPAGTRISSIGHRRLTANLPAPGRYLLRVRYVPYYRVRPAGCIRKGPGGISWLVAPRAGTFIVDVPRSPVSLWSAHDAASDCPGTGSQTVVRRP